MTTTTETAQALRGIANTIESLGMNGIRLTLHDVHAYNVEMKMRPDVSVDHENVHRATRLFIDHYGKVAQAVVKITPSVAVPVLIIRDLHICTLDSVWTRIARAVRDLPMPLRKKLFAAMHQWRQKEHDAQREEMERLAQKLAHLESVYDS